LPDATYESVIQVMREHSTYIIRRALDLTMDLATDSADIDEFAARFYAGMLDWKWPDPRWTKERNFSGSSVELVPLTAAALYFTKGDVNQAIIEAIGLGRDNDTTGGLAGNIAGAMQGASAIRPDWIETVEEANADFFEELEGDRSADFLSMSKRLVEALRNEANAAHERAALLDGLLV
jgi:ADP-ribosylglycohydrolase